jgi:hypothetical protein
LDRLTCRECKKKKPKKDFGKRFHQTGTYQRGKALCNECCRDRQIKSIYKNPRNYLSARLADTRQRAKKYEIELDERVDLTFLCDLFKSQDGLCAISKLPMTWMHEGLASNHGSRRGTNISIDRIDPEQGYLPENIRLVCDRVNKLKSNMVDGDLYFWCAILAKVISDV